MGGSKAVAKADWSATEGREVIVWPDADDAGRAYAEDVANAVLVAGAASVSVVDIPDGLPPGWDLADDLPEGISAQTRRTMLETATPVPVEASHDAIFNALAKLNRIEYDRHRKVTAERLGIRISTLDEEVDARRSISVAAKPKEPHGGDGFLQDPEPWDQPVSGIDLLDALKAEILRYIVLPDGSAEAVALWVLHAHTA